MVDPPVKGRHLPGHLRARPPFEQPDAFVAYMVNTVLTRTEAS